jgi:predicted unusual protein kinase regulating ubiquinone biosynthesis (AarF/ABC1/UbiB family)
MSARGPADAGRDPGADGPRTTDVPVSDAPPGGEAAHRKVPTSRLGRTARIAGLTAGQGLRWAGTRAANVARSDERAQEAMDDRALALAEQIVDQLGTMKGAAMKFGQVLSTVDFSAIPEGERERFKAKLATLRDVSPPQPFSRMRKLIESELGGPISATFSSFDEEAFAAASIGQVHRAVTLDGRDVAVKVQYPGIAEAVETDLRNLGVLLPLVKRLAPGLDVKAVAGELRERISEELDYELEAQRHREVQRAYRGHPFVKVPAVDTGLSTRRVLVTEYVHGERFEHIKQADQATRDRVGETVFRFFFGLLGRRRLCCGDPHPGNLLLCPDGKVCFLDFGLTRKIDEAYLEAERAIARAVTAGDAEGVHRGLGELGYLPEPDTFDPQRVFEQLALAGEWYFQPGFRRLSPEYVMELLDQGGSPRSPYFDQMRRQTIPPQALLMRRMEGMIFGVLGELRAGADWSELASEYFAGDAPATPLGQAEAEWLAGRGRRRAA